MLNVYCVMININRGSYSIDSHSNSFFGNSNILWWRNNANLFTNNGMGLEIAPVDIQLYSGAGVHTSCVCNIFA